ncbi:tubulin polyglutamylase TTLL4-like [Carassius auratus]|uniref:Tubulin polyglutamylase TTLL4-like n=1 Tax=Carassius auratus TaxID=7957 RepID=A0A6P6Q3H4_CARAU|nr:tubulin polyglutamylase TTLL4-like [Carassius auratus]XP_026128017.1 tubulin polyglutamylase TTLL4-like [Carassius auratus]XP_026128018.1 tubulin polyglutamylase TTLL4-like [Carassius auratus]
MASGGAEDIRNGASRPALVIQAKSAVVHSPSARGSFNAERKRSQGGAGDSVPQPNVRVLYDQPICVSGIPAQLAYPHVPTVRVSRIQSTSATSLNGAASNGLRTRSVLSKSLPHINAAPASCHSHRKTHWTLDSFRFKSGLLGKRAFSPQLSVCPASPSPPKSSSQKVIIEKTMPTNQSLPWTSNKLRENSNGVMRPPNAKMPTYSKQVTVDLHGPANIVSGCNGTHSRGLKTDATKPLQPSVPTTAWSYSKAAKDLKQFEKITVEDTRAVELDCCVGHGVNEAPQTKISSEAEFAATVVHKLTKINVHARGRTLNGVSNVKHLTGSTVPICLINEDKESCFAPMETNSALSFDITDKKCPSAAICDGKTQGGDCAIPEVTGHGIASPQPPSVYTVINQISAIQLTKEECYQASQVDASPMSLNEEEEESHEIQRQGMLLDGDEEELPDKLENDFSDDVDSDDCDISSTTSMATLSNVEEPISPDVDGDLVEKPALVPSLFPHMPSTLYFSTANERVELLPAEQRKLLKWKITTVTPNVVKNTISRSHFKATKMSHDWLGCWGHHMKSPGFKAIREFQKLNHFPGSFQIGRKDRLWRNLSKMQARFGKREFGFFPCSFILPQDIKLLRKAWEDGASKQKWIVKPPASARGVGIQVIHKWSQMPRKRPLLVQKYLHKPYLISGNKFDLRIYVYVTSYDPLRVYIFNDGLVRFASCKYSSSMKTLNNKFMHLTNYSVNKKNSEYQSNSDDKACQGHKWALKALWQYLGSQGVDTTLIWDEIKDMVIKTIITCDPYVNSRVKMHVRSSYSCHELFGFDIMLDESLKPWVLEVNISPSLHSNTPLDVSIKGQMIRDLLNLAGFVLPLREDTVPSSSSASSSTNSLCGAVREKWRSDVSTDEKVKRAFYLSQRFGEQDFCATILDVLTPDDVRVLAESEDELCRKGDFERVFPSHASSRYLCFFEQPRYLNILLNQWEQKYWLSRSKGINLLRGLCEKRVHLGNLADSVHHWSSKSYHGRRPQMTRSGVLVSPRSDAEDEDSSDREVQSVTMSIPDMSLLSTTSLSPSPTSSSSLTSHDDL